MTHWSTSQIPSQKGRLAVVTGTAGLGFEDALELARAGADVIVAGRNAQKGADAVARISAEVPAAKVRFELVDLANLESIRSFGKRLRHDHTKLDLLINNAGVMMTPKRQLTADGFELQLGTNYLGHFALTAELLPLLQTSRGARVVTLSSLAAHDGKIDFDDLQAQRRYTPLWVYCNTKLACLMFAFELQRQSEANGWGIESFAAHPGVCQTDLLHSSPGRWSPVGVMWSLTKFMFQTAAQGALPTLFAATSPEARAGAYYGPAKLNEHRGFPKLAKVPRRAEDKAVAEKLWRVSEQLTGTTFPTTNTRSADEASPL